jgi:hypothetical protein
MGCCTQSNRLQGPYGPVWSPPGQCGLAPRRIFESGAGGCFLLGAVRGSGARPGGLGHRRNHLLAQICPHTPSHSARCASSQPPRDCQRHPPGGPGTGCHWVQVQVQAERQEQASRRGGAGAGGAATGGAGGSRRGRSGLSVVELRNALGDVVLVSGTGEYLVGKGGRQGGGGGGAGPQAAVCRPGNHVSQLKLRQNKFNPCGP